MNRQSQWLFEAPLNLEASPPKLWMPGRMAHVQQSNVSCPNPQPVTIGNWGQYGITIWSAQALTINKLADLIVSSFAQSVCSPFKWVTIVGHADKDWQGPKKEMEVSFRRAMAVQKALTAAVRELWERRKMGPPPQGGVEWQTQGKGAKEMIARPYSAVNRRVVVTLIRNGPPIPPPFNWREATKRGLELLKKQPLPARQTKRLACLLQKVLEPNIIDAYLLYDYNVRQQVACVSAELAIKFLKNLKVDLARGGVFSPEVSDSELIKNLATIDYNIVEGIRKIDEHLQVNGKAADCFKRRMNQWIAANQQNQKSIYWCYGGGQP